MPMMRLPVIQLIIPGAAFRCSQRAMQPLVWISG